MINGLNEAAWLVERASLLADFVAEVSERNAIAVGASRRGAPVAALC
jgi:hypothetical protein